MYHQSVPPYVVPPQQYHPTGLSTFYNGPTPEEFTSAYAAGTPNYNGQAMYIPSPSIIIPSIQQPPPPRRERKTICVRDPNQDSKDSKEESMSGVGMSQNPTMPVGRPSCIPTPPQYHQSVPPYVVPPQQYSVHPTGLSTFYPGPAHGGFPPAYTAGNPNYTVQAMYTPSSSIIVPTPPAKREKKTICVQNPNQGSKEESMSGVGMSQNPTPPVERTSSIPTPPQLGSSMLASDVKSKIESYVLRWAALNATKKSTSMAEPSAAEAITPEPDNPEPEQMLPEVPDSAAQALKSISELAETATAPCHDDLELLPLSQSSTDSSTILETYSLDVKATTLPVWENVSSGTMTTLPTSSVAAAISDVLEPSQVLSQPGQAPVGTISTTKTSTWLALEENLQPTLQHNFSSCQVASSVPKTWKKTNEDVLVEQTQCLDRELTLDDQMYLEQAQLNLKKTCSGGAGAKTSESDYHYSTLQHSVPASSFSPSTSLKVDSRGSLSRFVRLGLKRNDKPLSTSQSDLPSVGGVSKEATNEPPQEEDMYILDTPKLQLSKASKSNLEFSKSRESVNVPDSTTDNPELSEEDMEKRSKSIINEFLHINDYEEAIQCVEELEQTTMLYVFVRVGVETTLERSQITRDHMGQVFHQLLQAGTLSKSQFFKGFSETLEIADDIAIDIPYIWHYLAELIIPVLQEGGIPMKELFSEFSKPSLPMARAGMLFSKILHLLCKQMSHMKVGALLRESGLSWTDFLPETEDVQSFITEQKQDLTLSDCSSSPDLVSTRTHSPNELNKQLEELGLKEVASDEEIFKWVKNKPKLGVEATVESSNVDSNTIQKPLLRNGRRQYNRDFLLNLQFIPACLQKPGELSLISDVVLDKIRQNKLPFRLDPQGLISRAPDFTSAFAVFNRLSSAERGAPLLSTSLRRPPPRKIFKNMPMNGEVKLTRAENAWKPSIKKETATETPEIKKTQELLRVVRSILNKLTPQMFIQLINQMKELDIDTEERLNGVVDLVFEKAIDEPNFSVLYGNMCCYLAKLKVPMTDKPTTAVTFQRLLLNRCQNEFVKDKTKDEVVEKKQQELEAATSASEQEKLQEELEEAKNKAHRRSIGNIKLIGELFKLRMLTETIIHECMKKLLQDDDEESLEWLCILLTTIGKELDFEKAAPRMDQYFKQMEKIMKEKKTSPRVHFMLQDMIDLRRNNWVSRRAELEPKTIEQIHKDAIFEEQEEQRKVHQQLLLNDKKRPEPRLCSFRLLMSRRAERVLQLEGQQRLAEQQGKRGSIQIRDRLLHMAVNG